MTPEQRTAAWIELRDTLLHASGIYRLLDWMTAWLDRHPRIVRAMDTPPLPLIGRFWYVPLIIAVILGSLLNTAS